MFDGSSFKVIDDFLPYNYWERIHSFLCSHDFPWYYQENIVNVGESGELGCYGFNYWILRPEETMCKHNYSHSVQETILPFAFFVQQSIGFKNEVSRVRCDMTVYNPNQHMHKPHVDMTDQQHIAAVYYVNNSDGNTRIFKNKLPLDGTFDYDENDLEVMVEVEPKANRLVLFDGSYLHTGHSPSKTNSRVIINSDYLI